MEGSAGEDKGHAVRERTYWLHMSRHADTARRGQERRTDQQPSAGHARAVRAVTTSRVANVFLLIEDTRASTISAGETSRAGVGFGLGFARVLDATVLGGLSVPGEYYWGGAASTAFWITPAEDLAVVFMTQVRPSSTYPIRRELRAIIYGSIVD
jgi:CubicO group peptidase (beta-lactamase class C family)